MRPGHLTKNVTGKAFCVPCGQEFTTIPPKDPDMRDDIDEQLEAKEAEGIRTEIEARYEAARRHREDQDRGVDRPREAYQVHPWWKRGSDAEAS